MLGSLSPSALDSGEGGGVLGRKTAVFCLSEPGVLLGCKGESFLCNFSLGWELCSIEEIREHQWQRYPDGQTMAEFRWRVL